MVNSICLPELQLIKASSSDTEAAFYVNFFYFQSIHLIQNSDKHNSFLVGEVSYSSSYEVYISQILLCAVLGFLMTITNKYIIKSFFS